MAGSGIGGVGALALCVFGCLGVSLPVAGMCF